jgi:hypothetical protein
VIEVLAEAVNRDDYPVCVAIFARFERWRWLSEAGFLGERDDAASEAG